MIIVGEQYGYKKPKALDKDISKHHPILNKQPYSKEFKQKKNELVENAHQLFVKALLQKEYMYPKKLWN